MTRHQERELQALFDPSRERPRELPEGQYEVLVFERSAEEGHSRPVPTAVLHKAFYRAESLREHPVLDLYRRDPAVECWMRIDPPYGEALFMAFRDVSREGIEALHRGGLEPILLVQVSPDRFDLVLYCGDWRGEAWEKQLRSTIAERFDLDPPTGAYLNAVRLPQSSTSSGFEVQLFAVGDKPPRSLDAFVSNMEIRSEIPRIEELADKLARTYSVPPLAALVPESLAVTPDPRPTEAAGALLRDVHEVRLLAAFHPRGASLAEGEEIAQLGLKLLRTWEPGSGLDERTRGHLLALEAGLASHTSEALRQLFATGSHRENAAQRLEGATKAAQARSATPTSLRDFQHALESYNQAERRLAEAIERFASWRHLQLRVDGEIHALSLVGQRAQPVSPAFHEVFERQADAARLAGIPETSSFASLPGTRGAQERLEHLTHELRAVASRSSTLSLEEARSVAGLLVARATASNDARLEGWRSSASPIPPGDPLPREPWVAEILLDHRKALALGSEHRAGVERATFLVNETLPQALLRLVQDGASTEALRQVHRLLSLETGLGPGPASRELLGRPLAQSAHRLNELERSIRDHAAQALEASPLPASLLRDLHRLVSVAVALTRQVDHAERNARGLPSPVPRPGYPAPVAWQIAWAARAVERGMAAPRIASHLGNAAIAASTTSTLRPGGTALELTRLALSESVQTLTRTVERRLTL